MIHVKISTVEFEVKNTLPGVNNLATRIDEAMQELKAQFSHLIVDGVAVTDAPLDYVKQNRKDIKEVEVIFITEDQKSQKKKAVKTEPSAKRGPIRVTISNIVFEVKRDLPGVEKMFLRIDESMKEFEVYFSHLIVDGTEVSETPREYVELNRESICNIEVIFLTADQYLHQVMTIIETFLEKAIPSLKEVAKEFYGKPDDNTWDRFTLGLQGLQSLVEIVSSVISDPAFAGKVGEFNTIGEKVGEVLLNLKDAAEKRDMTLVGDIMSYELLPFVDSLYKAVERLTHSQATSTH